MNKYFVIGLITAFVGFGIYDIKKTIEVKKEIERNKKLRQEKYEKRFKELNEKNKSELEKIEFNELKKIVENIFGSNEGEQYDKDWWRL